MPKSFLDDYVPVNERIDQFYAKYPEGRITTELVRYVETQVIVKAYVYRDGETIQPAGSGHAQMSLPGSNVARGAELETTETSAVGRALAMAGFEVKRSVASREEVEKNLKPDEIVKITPSEVKNVERGGRTDRINEAQLNAIRTLFGKAGIGTYKATKHIYDVLGDDLVLDADQDKAKSELAAYMADLSADEAGQLITHLDGLLAEAQEPVSVGEA